MWLGAAVAGLVLLVLAPGLRVGGVVFGWDTVGEHFAWESWVWSRYASGRGALWNSHVACGFPFPAQGTTGVFYPLAFPHLFLSHGQAADVVLALHLWILAMGCAAFVRRVGGGSAGALVAAAASLVAGPIVGSVLLGGRAQTFALAWVPWMLLATEQALAARDGRWLVLGGAAGGVSLLAGQPFATAQGLAGSLGYLLLRRRSEVETAPATRSKPWLGWLAMAGVAALVAAPQLAAWLEYRPLAGGQGQLPPVLDGLGALPPRQLVALLFPGLFGDEATSPYWGHFLLSVVQPYVGLGVMVLAAISLAGQFRGLARPLMAISAIALVLALGAHVPLVHRAWSHLPGATAFHFPARWLALFAVGVSLASGLGAARLVAAPRGDPAARQFGWVATAVIAVAVVLTFASTVSTHDGVGRGWRWLFDAALDDPLRASATQDAAPEVWMASAYAASEAALLRGLAAALVVLATGWVVARVPPRARAVSLVMLVAGEGGSWAWRYMSHLDPRALALPQPVVERLRSTEPAARYASTLAPSDMPGPRELVRHFAGLDQYAQMPMHAGLLAAVDSMQWGSYGLESVNRAVNGGLIFAQGFPTDRRWLDFLGVRWLMAPAGVASVGDLDGLRLAPESRGFDELRLVTREAGYTLFENPHALGRARVVASPIVVADATALAARLGDPGFDPASQVVVLARDVTAAIDVASGESGGAAGAVAWRARDDGYLALRVDAPSAGLLVVAESDYPGWRVWREGREARVVSVDGAFLGVEVPAGTTEVVFRYQPGWLWPALAASGLGLALAAGATLSLGRSSRRCGSSGGRCSRLAVAESP